MTIVPAADYLVVRTARRLEQKTKGGIVLPEGGSQEELVRGEVLMAGPGRTTEDGKLVPITVKAGDEILFQPYAGAECDFEGERYRLLQESEVRAFVCKTAKEKVPA